VKEISINSAGRKGADADIDSASQAAAPHSSQVATQHGENWATIDFSPGEDAWPPERRRAWRFFEIGVLLLLGSIISYSAFLAFRVPAYRFLAGFPFAAGIVVLMAAHGRRRYLHCASDDALQQLSVADGLLVRTARDHGKQVWYRHEVRYIAVDVGSADAGLLELILYLREGEPVVLHSVLCESPMNGERARTELESLAALLREALNLLAADRISYAIQRCP